MLHDLIVALGPQFETGHVSQLDQPAVGVLTTMSSNCSASARRPSVDIVYWKTCPEGTGGCPIWPAATCTFCCSIDLTTSLVDRSRLAIFCGSSQMRML